MRLPNGELAIGIAENPHPDVAALLAGRTLPTPPGEVILSEFRRRGWRFPEDWEQIAQAGLCATWIEPVITMDLEIYPELANALARAFNTTPEFWLDLQAEYNQAMQEHDARVAAWEASRRR